MGIYQASMLAALLCCFYSSFYYQAMTQRTKLVSNVPLVETLHMIHVLTLQYPYLVFVLQHF